MKRIDEVEKSPMENLDMVLMNHATNALYDFTEFNDLLETDAFIKSYEMDANQKGAEMLPKVSDNGCYFEYKRVKPVKKVKQSYYHHNPNEQPTGKLPPKKKPVSSS